MVGEKRKTVTFKQKNTTKKSRILSLEEDSWNKSDEKEINLVVFTFNGIS